MAEPDYVLFDPELYHGHALRVLPATAQHSALYECLTCNAPATTGFYHNAVIPGASYRDSTPNPCPELEKVWDVINLQQSETAHAGQQ